MTPEINSVSQNNLVAQSLPAAYSSKIQILPDNKEARVLAEKYAANPNIIKIDAYPVNIVRFYFKSGLVVEKGTTAGEDNFDILLPNDVTIKNFDSGEKRTVMLGCRYNSPFPMHATFQKLQKNPKENFYENSDYSINERDNNSVARLRFNLIKTDSPSPIAGEYKIDVGIKSEQPKGPSLFSQFIALFKRKPTTAKSVSEKPLKKAPAEDQCKYELLKINPDGSFAFADPSLYDELSKCFYRKWYDIGKERGLPAAPAVTKPAVSPSNDENKPTTIINKGPKI